MKNTKEIYLDYHFADNSNPPFIGIFVTTKSDYEAGNSPDADDIVQIPVNIRDSVVCDLMQDAANKSCSAVNAAGPATASQALSIAAQTLIDGGTAKNPAVAHFANVLAEASKKMSGIPKTIAVEFESVWDDGSVTTQAELDLTTGKVFNIEVSDDGSSFEQLQYEQISYPAKGITALVESDRSNEYFLKNLSMLQQFVEAASA